MRAISRMNKRFAKKNGATVFVLAKNGHSNSSADKKQLAKLAQDPCKGLPAGALAAALSVATAGNAYAEQLYNEASQPQLNSVVQQQDASSAPATTTAMQAK